ncbi:hypothetical protein PSCICN_03510 [Pseudomonas cichorii]|uniref:Hcp family type VI secretion system effector n=1 Tax=Pseudomonas cichorii TaxID=36746 RepID=UPI001910BCE7|nr:Hcp family type VI secretion system effector [Pseudomonas cichorii]GFM79659.1 hypothetical protein PSCICN_03510 [Pseudomonas cichorii]
MAHHGYMTIKGDTQGLMSEGCSDEKSIGNKCQKGHLNEIMVLSFAHQMSNVGNIKHATHRPIIIVKNVDKSSPLLAQALANREPVDCMIDFYRTSPKGLQEKFYSIEIKGGLISELMLDIPHAILQNGAEAQEHISIRYSEIIWTHHSARTRGHAFWGGE